MQERKRRVAQQEADRLAGDSEACARRRRREEVRYGNSEVQVREELERSENERASLAEQFERVAHHKAEIEQRLKRAEEVIEEQRQYAQQQEDAIKEKANSMKKITMGWVLERDDRVSHFTGFNNIDALVSFIRICYYVGLHRCYDTYEPELSGDYGAHTSEV